MDIILRDLFMYFFVVALAQGAIDSKSISNASQFVFDGSSSGYIITAGGISSNYLSNVYALNLDSGEWTDLPSLPYAACQFNLVLRDSTVYAVGGYNTVQQWTNQKTLIFSTKDNMWKIGSDLVFSYGSVLSASLNGSIYAVGGTLSNTLQAMGCNGAWNRLANSIYSHREYQDAIAVLNDKLYVLGCHHQDEMYDPSTDTWTAINMTNQDRCGAGIVALNGYIYVIGGANTKNERYDPATGDLTYFEACLYTPVSEAGDVTDGEKIYVVGGVIDGAYSNKVQVYRPDLDLWQSMSEYPVKVYLLGEVYVKELPTD